MIQTAIEVPYRILHASDDIRRFWGFSELSEAWLRSDDHCLMYPSFVLELRDVLTRQPLISLERLAERASLLREKTKAEAAFVDARKRKVDWLEDSRYRNASRKQREAEREHDKSKLQYVRRASRMDMKQRMKETQEEYLRVLEKLKQQALGEDLAPEPVTSEVNAPASVARGEHNEQPQASIALLRNSPYKDIRIGASASTKLNYITSEVCSSLISFTHMLSLERPRSKSTLRARKYSSSRSSLSIFFISQRR